MWSFFSVSREISLLKSSKAYYANRVEFSAFKKPWVDLCLGPVNTTDDPHKH